MRRSDFPVVDELTYLDSACMSLRPEPVIGKIEEYYREYPACPGRSAHCLADSATMELEQARQDIAGLIGADPGELMLTSGTTEAINTVAHGLDVDRVVVTDREHNSNLVPWQRADVGLEVVPTREGLEPADVGDLVDDRTLVSMVHVSNLDGHAFPVEAVADVVHDAGGRLLVDAAQSIPHRPFDVEAVGADLVAFSGHKMLGPSGTGGLYVRDGIQDDLEPLMAGGGAVTDADYDSAAFRGFPQGMEAGLPDLAGRIGLGAAARYLDDVGLDRVHSHEQRLTERMRDGLAAIDGLELVGKDDGVGVVSFRHEAVDAGQLAVMLDQRDIAVRSGRHCLHAWFDRYDAAPTVRASTHLYTNEDDIDRLVEAVRRIGLLG